MKSVPSKKFSQLTLTGPPQPLSQVPRPGRTSTTSLDGVLTGAITKAPDRKPTVGKTTVRGRSDEKLLIHTYSEDDMESYDRELSIMSTVSHISALTNHAPRLIQADPDSRVIILSTPSLRWFPLLYHMQASKFDLNQLLAFKQKLRQYVEILYSHGVAYRVKHNSVFPAQKMSGRWVLHLSGWLDAGYCSDSSHLQSAEWKERETKQMNEIDRIFGLLVMRYEDMHDKKANMKDGLAAYRVKPWELKGLLLPQDDE